MILFFALAFVLPTFDSVEDLVSKEFNLRWRRGSLDTGRHKHQGGNKDAKTESGKSGWW